MRELCVHSWENYKEKHKRWVIIHLVMILTYNYLKFLHPSSEHPHHVHHKLGGCYEFSINTNE